MASEFIETKMKLPSIELYIILNMIYVFSTKKKEISK